MQTSPLQQILQQQFNREVRGVGGNTDTGISKTNHTDSVLPLITNRRDWRAIDRIADKLEAMFGTQTPSRRPYYCKVAWQLPEGTVWQLAEQAQHGRAPAKLFSWLTRYELDKLARSADN